ncbi:AgmX/PglI C-terminal domain-containing protein [Archangium lansingense]|uniref:AgmX/PglI C-terminal domain-containing protein n=1 Tax=Archangium lansingense TaxID=2995310 RepID=A0ABT4A7T9_9BACT|nr:AgmX/PglI C-terminal domain-containing protein [Archangium lansinium]MCY1077723.1 AgmX/PglI C-terminal domain-containing protein [Archangium lansinium]
MSAAKDLHDPEREQLDSHWLYRQGDLVLGPLTGHQLVEKLYTGVLTGKTEVSATGPSGFRKLEELDAFKLHVSKAAAKTRVEAEARALRSRRMRQGLLAACVAVVVLGGLGAGAWQIARYSSVYLPGVDKELSIEVSAPVITVAKRSRPEELFEYPGEPKQQTSERPPSKPTETTTPDKTDKPEKLASLTPGSKPDRRPTGGRPTGRVSTDPDGMSTEVNYDQAAINRVVKQSQATLHRCFKAEAERRPGFAAKVPLEFTIGNDGRVAQLWVDHPQLKKGPLFDCLLGEMKKWPFKPYTGERATVNLAFTIGKK